MSSIQQSIDYTRARQLAEQVLDQAASDDMANDDYALTHKLSSAGLSTEVLLGKKIDLDDLPFIAIDSDGGFHRVEDESDFAYFRMNYDMSSTFIIINY